MNINLGKISYVFLNDVSINKILVDNTEVYEWTYPYLQVWYNDGTDRTYEVTSIDSSTIEDKGNVVNAVAGNRVTSIGDNAFQNCSNLTSVTINDGVTSIESSAFSGCSSLTTVTLNSNSIVSKNYTSSSNLQNIFGNQVTEYIIGGCVTSIGEFAFQFCSGLTSVIIPSSVTIIGKAAFHTCSGLTSITIGIGVTSIGDGAFYGCSKLTTIEIPNSVTSIGGYTFYGCSGLTSITIGSGVTSIGNNAFYNCSGLTSITIDYNNHIYDSRDNCNAIIDTSTNTLIIGCKNTVIPNSVTIIGESAFENCSGLTSITIPNSVTHIGYRAFWGTPWEDDWEESQPDGVLYINKTAYKYKGDISEEVDIVFEEGTLEIADWIFSGASIKSVTIPNSVTYIGEFAFECCWNLTSVTIPENVRYIGNYAFDESSVYTMVCMNVNPPSIGSSTISWSTGEIYVPDESVDAYKSATNWSAYRYSIYPISEIDQSHNDYEDDYEE